jgi:hypothetical protein
MVGSDTLVRAWLEGDWTVAPQWPDCPRRRPDAYPVTPPPESKDNVIMKSVPGSTKQYTQAQIDDIRDGLKDWPRIKKLMAP